MGRVILKVQWPRTALKIPFFARAFSQHASCECSIKKTVPLAAFLVSLNLKSAWVSKPSFCAEAEQPASKKAKLSQTIKPSAIVLDIEGTITPISFVTNTLFPYAREHLEEHLQSTYESDETQADIALLQDEVREPKTT